MSAESVRAVLFDLDGTLVGSIGSLRSAFERFLADRGVLTTADDFERYNGPPLTRVVEALRADYDLAGDHATLFEAYMRTLGTSYVEQTTLNPAALPLIDALERAGVAVAVVTSAPFRLAQPLLERFGVAPKLGALVTADDVSEGKPAPLGYLEALRRLDVRAREAIAVEDSTAGVRAARAAGLRTIGIGSNLAPLFEAGARLVVRDLAEAKSVLEARLSGTGRVFSAPRITLRSQEKERQLSESTRAAVDANWAREIERRPSLVDGEILSVDTFDAIEGGVELMLHRCRYRSYLAQRRGIAQGVRPLGVTAIALLDGSRVVLGKRGDDVTQFPGAWELLVSGSVSAACLLDERGAVAQVEEELDEELGVGKDAVVEIEPLGLLEDFDEAVLDLVYRATIRASDEAIRRHVLGNGEHTDVLVVTSADASRLAERGELRFIPATRALLGLLEAFAVVTTKARP